LINEHILQGPSAPMSSPVQLASSPVHSVHPIEQLPTNSALMSTLPAVPLFQMNGNQERVLQVLRQL
jgi:hypothetical protein